MSGEQQACRAAVTPVAAAEKETTAPPCAAAPEKQTAPAAAVLQNPYRRIFTTTPDFTTLARRAYDAEKKTTK